MKTHICLSNGQPFDLYDESTWSNLTVDVIAQALSRINRYLGHTRRPYSVATHSVCCSYQVPAGYELAALLHDAPEAVLGDVPNPWKQLPMFAEFRAIEDRILAHCYKQFGVPFTEVPEVVKAADATCFQREVAHEFGRQDAAMWGIDIVEPNDDTPMLLDLDHVGSRLYFLARFKELRHAQV